MSSALDSLTARQRRFVESVAAGMPAGRAYEAAGYKPRGDAADASASRTLGYAKVKAALAEVQSSTPEIADKAERQRWLTDVLRGAIEDARLSDRLKACELLAKIGGDMVQRHQVEGAVPVTIVRPDPIDE
jgi:phage terminase small subunit